MLEFKMDDVKPHTTVYREGVEKCQIDYQHLRRCLLDPDKNMGELAIGHLLFVLENHEGTFQKLDRSELRTFSDFLDSLQSGGSEVAKKFQELQTARVSQDHSD